nr:RNA-directed DNA polymerase, eukaryota, reverse transcriptase zinc-binding domain protein [Tanacetum cinerariifolium]
MALMQQIIERLNEEIDADRKTINRITTLLRELLVDGDQGEESIEEILKLPLTRFHHLSMFSPRNNNVVDELSMVKREFFNHFRNRFDKPDGIRAITHMEYPRRISLDKQSELEGEIPDANLVKDFRPISLIGSLYKIIAKILANRLAGVLGDIVNEVQSAFVADRQIFDGPFILNEVIQWCKLKKKQSLVFKVDFEKAYDSVRWDFLDDILGKFGFDDILGKFGFGDKCRMWIQSCLKSSRGSIIINGSLTKEFQFFKGLKQGDPLSPFLFILVMESLRLSFQRVEEAKMFKGIKIGPAVTLSHMFYSDDAVFVGKWCESNITTLVQV